MRYFYLLLVVVFLAGCASSGTPRPPAQESAQVQSTESLKSSSRGTEVFVPNAQSGGGSTVEIIGGDEASLREFVQRWLAPIYPGAPRSVITVRIGELPEVLPVDVPLPKGSRIVGSVQQPENYTQIILDVDVTPDEVNAFYSQSLADVGWQAAPQQTQSGFVGPSDSPARYCRQDDNSYLEVWTLARGEGSTDVRLNMYPSMAGNFCQQGGPSSMDEGMSLIPVLEAPAGTQMLGGGSGGSGDGSAYISSDLETSLSASELLQHYNAQLSAAGWELVDQGTTPVVAWSTWKLAGKDGKVWSGTLFVMERQLNAEKRFAMLSVERAP